MKNCISINQSNSSTLINKVTLYQYGQNPMEISLTQANSLDSLIKLVSRKLSFKKIRLFDHRCQELFEEDLKYLRNESKIYITTNGKSLDGRFVLFEYNPLSVLCKGGQATVMLISHKTTCEERALKFISEGQENQYLYIAREAVILEQLKHRNIVKLYKYKLFPEKSEAVLELEYLKGGSLLDYVLDHGALDEPTARIFFNQILDGISYCHKNNVIHRDLKLDNILLCDTTDLRIKIIDFGLAYLSGTGIPFDEPLNVGTVLYASPEIVFGKLKSVNFSVDIWALGVILYYLVFAEYPFKGENNTDILLNISEGNYNIPKQVSWELISLLTDLFNPDYENRITLKEIKQHKWVKGLIQSNHQLSIPLSEMPTTSKGQQTFENSIRKTKEDILHQIEKQQLSSINSEKLYKRLTPKSCIQHLLK
ncbi:unnamed protein product [Paramecium primaurelia]|uniref:Protein kinase domain-containing protein n=1 Tax=Paramecium primaurelia TaxID=5886 RepID=A0A8S1NV03_PARPR|nr:unnamed protein product [Paramecium primaurelia]